MFRLAEVRDRVPVHSAGVDVDDELSRHVPFALRGKILDDGSKVVAVLSWYRDREALVERTTSRIFTAVTARVVAFSMTPGETALAIPKTESADGMSGTVGPVTVFARRPRGGEGVTRVKLERQVDDDQWTALCV